MYIPEDNQNYYTNLEVGNLSDAKSKTTCFNDKLSAYAIIDVKNGNIEAKTNNVLTSNILSYLNTYKYAFSKGGKLYIGVLDDTVEGFGEYTTEDNYAQIKDFASKKRLNMKLTVGWIMFLLLLSNYQYIKHRFPNLIHHCIYHYHQKFPLQYSSRC